MPDATPRTCKTGHKAGDSPVRTRLVISATTPRLTLLAHLRLNLADAEVGRDSKSIDFTDDARGRRPRGRRRALAALMPAVTP